MVSIGTAWGKTVVYLLDKKLTENHEKATCINDRNLHVFYFILFF